MVFCFIFYIEHSLNFLHTHCTKNQLLYAPINSERFKHNYTKCSININTFVGDSAEFPVVRTVSADQIFDEFHIAVLQPKVCVPERVRVAAVGVFRVRHYGRRDGKCDAARCKRDTRNFQPTRLIAGRSGLQVELLAGRRVVEQHWTLASNDQIQ